MKSIHWAILFAAAGAFVSAKRAIIDPLEVTGVAFVGGLVGYCVGWAVTKTHDK